MENNQMMVEGESAQFESVRHGFTVGNLNLLVPHLTRCEVSVQPNICKIPTTPEWFVGFINHRGETVPVYDLTRYLGFELPVANSQKWILQIGTQSDTIGFLIYHYPQVVIDPTKEEADSENLPEKIRPYIGQSYGFQSHKWLDFDHQQMIDSMKKQF